MENSRDLIVTLADSNYLNHAKQLFSSIYWNAGWHGDYMLLAHEIPETELEWFHKKAILVKKCVPLFDKDLGAEKYPPVVLDKFYLFTPEFKKWRNIIFLDADIIVRASLKDLARVKTFASPHLMGDRLKFFLHPDGNGALYKSLEEKYDLDSMPFNSGVMAFPTKIIDDGLFDILLNTFNEYRDIISGDDPVFNLVFYKKWAKLPLVFDIAPETIEAKTGINKHLLKGIIFHFKDGELNDKQSPFYSEWNINLIRADKIDLKMRQRGYSWGKFKIFHYSLYLNAKYRFRSSFQYIRNIPDRLAGTIGSFLKKNSPGMYFRFKKIMVKYPSIYILEITDTCIARCHQCEMWKQKRAENELRTEEKVRLIDEICELNKTKNPYVHFSGGEPFIKTQEVLALARHCNNKGIHCGVDTTGFFIDEKLAMDICSTGMSVNISLDSVNPEIHDGIRGLRDCHKKAISAIDNLIKHGGPERVVLVNVLNKKNISDAEEMIRFANEKKLKIQFQPLMLNPVKDPEFLKSEYWPDDTGKLNEAFGKIKKMIRVGYQTHISEKKLSKFKKYFQKGFPSEKCTYYKNNLSIDSIGDVRLCFFSEPIGNVREYSIQELYHSKKANEIRHQLKNCSSKSCNLPVCQDANRKKSRFSTRAFRYMRSLPDRLAGGFGVFLKNHRPEMYHKLKKQ